MKKLNKFIAAKLALISNCFLKWSLEGWCRCIMGGLGRLIALHPLPFFIIPLLITIVFAYPFYRGISHYRNLSKDRSGTIDLYTPDNGRSRVDRHRMSSIFPDGGYFSDRTVISPNLFIILVAAADGDTVLRNEIADAYFKLREMLEELEFFAASTGHMLSYRSICDEYLAYRRSNVVAGPFKCLPDALLEIWTAKTSGWLKDITYPSVNISVPVSSSAELALSQAFYVGPIFGSVTTDESSGRITHARYVRMIFSFPTELLNVTLGQEDLSAFSAAFHGLLANYSSPLLRLHPWSAQRYAVDMNAVSHRTVRLVPALVASLLLFALASCCMLDSVRSKPWLAVSGIVSAGMGIVFGYGILFLLQQQLIEIAMIVPFLVMSLAVDEMFVLLNVWRTSCHCMSVVDRVHHTFDDAAVSITISAITDATVFAIGASTWFPACRIFCIFSAMSIVTVYLFQITFFGACLVYTGRREYAGRHCLTFRKVKGWQGPCFCKEEQSLTDNDALSPRNAHEPWPTIFFKCYYARLINTTAAKLLVMVSYAAYLGLSVWFMLTRLKQGLYVSNLVPYDSSTYEYLRIYEVDFSQYGPVAEVVLADELDYSAAEVQRQLLSFVTTLEYTRHTLRVDFWLLDLLEFAKNSPVPIVYDDLAAFVRNVFLKHPLYSRHNGNLKFRQIGNGGSGGPGSGREVIASSRMWVQMTNVGFENRSEAMRLLRRKVDELETLSALVYDVSFPLAEQFEQIVPSTLYDVLIGVAVMGLTALLLIPSRVSCFCVGISVASINVGVIGFMAFWQINLDIIALITILLAVGLSVDYTSHVAYHFIRSKAPDVDGKVRDAMEMIGWPILQSSIGTILGVLTIVFVGAYIANTFVKTVVLVMLIGIYHGLLVLPVLLACLTQLFLPQPASSSSAASSTDSDSGKAASAAACSLPPPPTDSFRKYDCASLAFAFRPPAATSVDNYINNAILHDICKRQPLATVHNLLYSSQHLPPAVSMTPPLRLCNNLWPTQPHAPPLPPRRVESRYSSDKQHSRSQINRMRHLMSS